MYLVILFTRDTAS